jgi:AAA domain-containing protein
MIIEGFEIENWTCIKKLTVSDLPPTGVIVLHGPNRRGKSSLVQALRACLMDYSSTSTALKNFYPRGSGEKPTVTVTFRVGGTAYRIKKCFGSNKSELASRTSTGDWRVETATAVEAHSRVCDMVGGDDSGKGLRQLLWLTQAEFRLPEPKKFDANVQAQLRGILGVLQTPLATTGSSIVSGSAGMSGTAASAKPGNNIRLRMDAGTRRTWAGRQKLKPN